MIGVDDDDGKTSSLLLHIIAFYLLLFIMVDWFLASLVGWFIGELVFRCFMLVPASLFPVFLFPPNSTAHYFIPLCS